MGAWTAGSPPPPTAPDAALDAFVGLRGAFNSSARFQGRPGYRASSAFDGTPRPWIGSWQDGRRVWIEWEDGATLRALTLDPVPGVRQPTRVRLRSESAASPPVDVGPDGAVRLPEPVSGRRFRLEILRAAFAAGTPGTERQRRAVGIAEIRGRGVPSVRVPRDGALRPDCRRVAVEVGGRTPSGSASRARSPDFDAGRPLRARGCDARSPAGGGDAAVGARRGRSRPTCCACARARARRSRHRAAWCRRDGATRGGREGIQLALTGPARLILAESFTRGRRATCDGQDLGEPDVGDGFGTAWRVPATAGA